MKQFFYYCVVLFMFVPNLFAQNNNSYYFTNLDIDQGLSQNTVNTIFQDEIGFMWFGTKNGLNRYDGVSFKIFSQKSGDIDNNTITALHEDEKGHIWIGTNSGIYIYQPKTEKMTPFDIKTPKGTSISQTVSFITENEGFIYIAVTGDGMFKYDQQAKTLEEVAVPWAGVTRILFDDNDVCWISLYSDNLFYSKDSLKTFHPFVAENGSSPFKGDIINKIITGDENTLYIGSAKGGLKSLNTVTNRVESLLLTDEKGGTIYVREIIPYTKNELWLGTESGLYIYDIPSKSTIHITREIGNPYSLSDNVIYSMCKDKEGGVWIGSFFGGVSYYSGEYNSFKKFFPRNETDPLGERVREFAPDKDGSLWIGTEDKGLMHYTPKSGEIKQFKNPLIHTNVHGLCRDNQYLWVGTFSRGISRINLSNGYVKSYWDTQLGENQLNDVFSICKTKENELLLGTSNGLYIYDRDRDIFIKDRQIPSTLIFDIFQDSRGYIWLATYDDGLYMFEWENDKWTQFTNMPGDSTSLPCNKVICVYEDNSKRLWFSTEGGGVCQYNYDKGAFINYDFAKCNLPCDIIYQIIEDNEGLFWLSSNRGLIRLNPTTKQFRLYTSADGLLSNQFNYKSSYKDSDGRIYLGCISGFICFSPETFIDNEIVSPIVITDFLLFNEKVVPGQSNSPLTQSITHTKNLILSHHQNTFSFRIAKLSYLNRGNNKLWYKLQNFDSDWIESTDGVINYSNLPYGSYVFCIKSSDSDEENPESLSYLNIEIKPPFYLSIWAFVFYALFFIVSIYLIAKYYYNLIARRNAQKMRRFEQEKEIELYNAKFDFYTNVAHEIRTPLTLIKGPLEVILKDGELSDELRYDLSIMNRNSDRLLSLTNQLLDFRRIESNQTNLVYSYCNINDLVKNNSQLFIPLAKQKGLTLVVETPEESLFSLIDFDAVCKIINNLLNNAVKYAVQEIKVSLKTNELTSEFEITVFNDGVPIPVDMQEEVFKPFVQIKDSTQQTGTGIGLALSRSLAELHEGTLSVDKVAVGCSFTLRIPIIEDLEQKFEQVEFSTETDLDESETLTIDSDDVECHGSTILVVEDNIDMLEFIVRQLKSSYNVLTAEDGVLALDVIKEHTVHLVISDIMMPNMSGLELCDNLKNNIEYSHIPIILLTAKADVESKIAGLYHEADAYIEKPFSFKYLKANVYSLLSNRNKLRKAFASSPFVYTASVATTKTEASFLKQLSEIVNQNISDPEFYVDDLAKAIGMSRSSLNRKIRESLDLSTSEYIKVERLKKAAFLLKNENLYVNEVCYRVGFNTPSYFSKCFYEQFGVLPKDFV